MYVDDQGVLKGLPVNVRASQVAQLCGLALEVRGDAFLARFRDNDDDFERMDFSLAELSSSAPWVAEARAFQEDKRRRGDTTEAAYERLMSGVGAGARAGAGKANKDTINTEAQREKERGNEEFRAGRWGSAVECYSRAVEADPGLTAALSNRAMALIKLGRYADALADCERVVGANTGDVKGLLRRATCYRRGMGGHGKHRGHRVRFSVRGVPSAPLAGPHLRYTRRELGRAEEARRDYERVLNMQPRNKDALSGLDAMGVQPDTATP